MSEGQASANTKAPIRRPEGRLGLRTLILIRWIAVIGQSATILIVHFGFGFALPMLGCLSVVALTALSNVMLMLRMPVRARLGDRGAALLLGFDMLQLGMLLYLTGGLENPFSILILAPVTVAATILSRGPTLALTTLAIVLVTALAFFHAPLPWTGEGVTLPFAYTLGVWTALCVASVFIAAYIWSVVDEARRMSDGLAAAEASLSRVQNVSSLGGLAAAAAHELGSPLATIAVVAKELSREVPPDSPFAEDVALLISQSDRCRTILAGLSQRPDMAGHRPLELLKFSTLVAQACDAYQDSGVVVVIEIDPGCVSDEPEAPETSEFMHGVGNLIQNAVQFAANRVELRLFWNETAIRLIVRDDGPGFPAPVLASLGEPYISTRGGAEGHMGLGVFIAQTLLEADGAMLQFANRGGAEVVIRWPRDMFERRAQQRLEQG